MKIRIIIFWLFSGVSQLRAQQQVIQWLDTTMTDGRYLRIYTTEDNKWGNLYAEWGQNRLKNKMDLGQFEKGYLVGETDFRLSWTTENTFVLKKGCGTSCLYALIFDIRRGTPSWLPVDVTPDNNNDRFYIDDKALVVNFSFNKYPEVNIKNIENGKVYKLQLPKDWGSGMGTFYHIVDSLTIRNETLSIFQETDNGVISKTITKKIELR